MTREKFDSRRATFTVNVAHKYPSALEPHIFCVSYSHKKSGGIGEVWVNSVDDTEKRVNDDVKDFCVILSIALQYGASLDDIAKSIIRASKSGRAHGFMGAIIDALRKEPVG